MARRRELFCSVVTPEAAVWQAEASFVAMPAHDGEIGVLRDRAPLVCKLGVGELRIDSPEGMEHFLIDGGFAQVLDNEVTILTGRAVPVDELRRAEAETALKAALAMPITDAKSFEARQTALARARAALRLATR